MTEHDMTAAISTTAQQVFDQPSICYAATQLFRELPGFNSILAIQYILTIESTLGITLNEQDVDNMHTMGDLLTMIQAKKA